MTRERAPYTAKKIKEKIIKKRVKMQWSLDPRSKGLQLRPVGFLKRGSVQETKPVRFYYV